MGRSLSITFTVEMTTCNPDGRLSVGTPSEWRTRARRGVSSHGAPSVENLVRYIRAFEGSTAKGGCNAHLGLQKVLTAKIVRQSCRVVVVEYKG